MFLCPGTVLALGPHEVLLLANGRSADSVMIAKEYAQARGIPEINLVRLSLPDHVGGATRISPRDFESQVLRPAQRAVDERGLAGQILAWVYSTDFPTVVMTTPPVSLQGFTFVRGRLPSTNDIHNGTYLSPLFAGPSTPDTVGDRSQTFDVYREWLQTDMPLPSMMLGYAGPRGNTTDEIRQCLQAGRYADGTAPSGTVYFVVGQDIRSQCRHWQYPGARVELAGMGVQARLVETLPPASRDILGVMMGSAVVNPDRDNGYRPGCMAEHLTSLAGAFEHDGQTKLSVWIRAGATASAGTVVEPMAIWRKFPHARFYVHYAAGCSIMESFFQAVASPLQILLVGDPLAQPWAPRATVEVEEWPGVVSDAVTLKAGARDEQGRFYGKVVYLVDGRQVASGRHVRLDTRDLAPGRHTLRVVAYRTGLVRTQAWMEKPFDVAR